MCSVGSAWFSCRKVAVKGEVISRVEVSCSIVNTYMGVHEGGQCYQRFANMYY